MSVAFCDKQITGYNLRVIGLVRNKVWPDLFSVLQLVSIKGHAYSFLACEEYSFFAFPFGLQKGKKQQLSFAVSMVAIHAAKKRSFFLDWHEACLFSGVDGCHAKGYQQTSDYMDSTYHFSICPYEITAIVQAWIQGVFKFILNLASG